MRVPNKNNFKYIESCIGRRDLLSFIFESFEDMKAFLEDMRRQNIRVGAGEVPRDDVNFNVEPPEDLK